MADRPIIMSAPMVRAILDGRKTQTRRVLARARVFETPGASAFTLAGNDMVRALQNAAGFQRIDGDGWTWEADAYEWQAPAKRTQWFAHIGYAPGGRLWVKEAHALVYEGFRAYPIYRAGHAEASGSGPRVDERWRSPIHMPRWASRITLHVTDVRVQRLQEISEADAEAEGVFRHVAEHSLDKVFRSERGETAIHYFRDLWDGLNAKRGFGWEQNPWVVVLNFRAELRNIDQCEAP